MRVLVGVTVDPKQIERLTKQIGQERQSERDAEVAAWLARPLAQREDPPSAKSPPPLAVVEMDGGRLQIRGDGASKFWTEQGAEAILQLRADYLSDEEPLEDFWQRRQEAATGQRRYRRRSA